MPPAHILRPLLRTQTLGISLGLSLTGLHLVTQKPHRLDTFDTPVFSRQSYKKNAKTPVLANGSLNPGAVRQISSGSIAGLIAGLGVSVFSRTLAALIGIFIVGIQYAASKGINILPYEKLQRHVTSMDLRSAIQDNVAFKVSFGTTFLMAAFMKF